MSDMYVTGKTTPGSQQQWFSRNAHLGSADNTVWNGVWVGSPGAPTSHCSNNGGGPNSTIDATPVIREKPYLVFDNNRYYIASPKPESNKVGQTANWENANLIDFDKVYVAKSTDSAAEINTKLDEGLHLVLQPGIYHLEESLKLQHTNQVLLGLGLATLIPTNGNSCIEVSATGVQVAGVLLEAGLKHSDVLLKFGNAGQQGNSANPGSISDVFARSGRFYGSTASTAADTLIQVNQSHVVVDDVWLWRADHDLHGLVQDSLNPVLTGLEVNGDYVYGYGLAVEHTLGDLLKWNGNHGQTYFY